MKQFWYAAIFHFCLSSVVSAQTDLKNVATTDLQLEISMLEAMRGAAVDIESSIHTARFVSTVVSVCNGSNFETALLDQEVFLSDLTAYTGVIYPVSLSEGAWKLAQSAGCSVPEEQVDVVVELFSGAVTQSLVEEAINIRMVEIRRRLLGDGFGSGVEATIREELMKALTEK